MFESCSGSNEDGGFLDGTSINTAFLDGTLLNTDDDDRADGGCSTKRSVSFQSFNDNDNSETGDGDCVGAFLVRILFDTDDDDLAGSNSRD